MNGAGVTCLCRYYFDSERVNKVTACRRREQLVVTNKIQQQKSQECKKKKDISDPTCFIWIKLRLRGRDYEHVCMHVIFGLYPHIFRITFLG